MIIGSYFGEIEIIFKTKRYHTTVAAENSELLTLSKQIYESIIMKDFYEIHEEIKFIAGVRHEKNMEAEKFLNQTLANNKERMKNKCSIFGKKDRQSQLGKALLEMKRYKKDIQLLELKRSKSLDLLTISNKEVMARIVNRLFSTETLIREKMVNVKQSQQSIIEIQLGRFTAGGTNKTNSLNKTEDSLKKNSVFNWSSDSDGDYSDNKKGNNGLNKGKLAFYNKLISANKTNQNSRRPSFILNQILQTKNMGEHTTEAIKEESSDDRSQNSINNLKKLGQKLRRQSTKRNSFDDKVSKEPALTINSRSIKRGKTFVKKKSNSEITLGLNSTHSDVGSTIRASLAGNINDFCDSQKFALENLSKIVGELKNTIKDINS